MISKYLTRFYSGLLVVIVFLSFFNIFIPRVAYALENCTEAKLRDLGVAVVNCSGENKCVAPTANAVAQPLVSGSSVYILGDSITYQSTNKIESAFAEAPAPYTPAW